MSGPVWYVGLNRVEKYLKDGNLDPTYVYVVRKDRTVLDALQLLSIQRTKIHKFSSTPPHKYLGELK